MWFENESGENQWACSTLKELHRNERDPEAVQEWNGIVENNLKELIGITYTNKMHILFGSLSFKNSTVKHA